MPLTHAVTLRGITWNHSRGFTPLAATAQRFHELQPDIEIAWARRSLQDFADKPLDRLAEEFDLLVIDHPSVGFAEKTKALISLSSYVPDESLRMRGQESVGASNESYCLNGEQWALAIDAAAPVSVWRPDLLERHGGAPTDWGELIQLGRKGLVACPSIPLDVYGNFLNLCVSLGGHIFPDEERVVAAETGAAALGMLRELSSIIPRECLHLNPIRILEMMAQQDDVAYCPFIYGYSNYARPGYALHRLRFGKPVRLAADVEPRTMLGGAGLAISAHCSNPQAAIDYALYVASPEIQRGLYFQAGGQPALRSAWTDVEANRMTGNFFAETLPSLKRAFVRPRYYGYLDFQDNAGRVIHTYLREGGLTLDVLANLDAFYRDSLESR